MNPEQMWKEGGPAFPVSIPGCGDNGMSGMTLRDYFAAKAMQGLVAGSDVERITSLQGAAEWVYTVADALLKARGGK